MLTITQDWILTDVTVVEHAYTDEIEIFAETRATCVLAKALLKRGVDPAEDVVLLRADPWLFPAPHRIEGVSLETVSTIDFFSTCPQNLYKDLQPFQDVLRT